MAITLKDNSIKIVKANGTFGTENKADTATNWPTTDTYASYGGSSDLWSETWTPADINDVDFGVALSVVQAGDDYGVTASVDHIRITVYYTEAVADNGSPFFGFI
jgi:hypothetical protein